MFFKPMSWGIDLAYEHFKDQSDYLKIKPETGLTYGNDKDFVYLMIGSNLYYKSSDQLYSIGSSIGLVTNRFDNIKLGLNYSYDKYNKSLENNQFEVFGTYKLDQNASLSLKYLNDDLYKQNDEKVKVGVSYYF